MAHDVATRLHNVAGDGSAAARTVFSGSGLILCALVANSADAAEDTVTFQDSDGNTLFILEVDQNSSEDWSPKVMVDNGLVVVSASAASTTNISVAWRPQ